MKKLLSIIFLTMTIISCSCDSTEPPIGIDPPGRRDYIWTIDTLDAPSNTYYRMWASSPNDIWLVGSGSWDKSIAHFDGEVWSYYGVPGIIAPFSIYGFSNNDIIVGAENGNIWRFDGNSWNHFAKLTKDGRSDIVFDNIWGNSPQNFYAFGAYTDEQGYANNSVIAQFSSGEWNMFNTDGINGIVEHLYMNKPDNKIYLQAIEGAPNDPDTTFIYEYNNGLYTELYGNLWTKGLQGDISLINDQVYFILGNEIAIRSNNQFYTILKVNNPNFYQRIWGRSSKDIFLLMTDGLAHFDGIDIEYLFYFNITPRTQIYGASLFDKDAFFIIDEANTNLKLIYYGRLE